MTEPATRTGRRAGRSRASAIGPWLVLPAGLCLLVGLDAGLTRAGLPSPVPSARVGDLHGPVMVLGFLGTVIALERATALRRAWALLSPALLGLGGLLLVLLPQPVLGRLLMLQGAATLLLVYAALWRRSRELTVGVQALGAVLLTLAAGLLLRVPVESAVPLLMGFAVLTIAAERVELARLAMPDSAGWRLTVGAVAVAVLCLAAVLWPGAGGALLGVALVALTLWLAQHDVARRLVRSVGLPRFSAVALLAGYAWLLVAGVVLAARGRPSPDSAAYDTVVHASFLGFAMSMVLAHAPVILPAVLGRPLPYHRAMYVPLALLHVTLAVRLGGGAVTSALDSRTPWQMGAAGTVIALLTFVLVSLAVSVRAAHHRKQSS